MRLLYPVELISVMMDVVSGENVPTDLRMPAASDKLKCATPPGRLKRIPILQQVGPCHRIGLIRDFTG